MFSLLFGVRRGTGISAGCPTFAGSLKSAANTPNSLSPKLSVVTVRELGTKRSYRNQKQFPARVDFVGSCWLLLVAVWLCLVLVARGLSGQNQPVMKTVIVMHRSRFPCGNSLFFLARVPCPGRAPKIMHEKVSASHLCRGGSPAFPKLQNGQAVIRVEDVVRQHNATVGFERTRRLAPFDDGDQGAR